MNAKRTCLAVLAAVAFSALYLQDSIRAGRLRQDLLFDDVVYTVDGARRLEVASSQGLVAFARTFVETPPHSPLETALAVSALGTFGYRDSSIYVMNALLLVAGVLLLVFVFRRQRAWVVALVVLAYLTSPLAYRTLVEFRPDFALGLATAAFAVLFLRGALEQDVRELRLSGLALGVALLVKPPFLPHTLAIALFVVGVALVLRRWGRVEVARPRELARAFLGAAIAIPHYALNGRAIVEYFWTNTKGKEAYIWAFHAPWWRVVHHFTLNRKHDAFRTIGNHVYVLLAVSVAGCVWLAVRGRRRELLLVGAVLATAAASLAIVVAVDMDVGYFALPFQTLLMMAAFLSVVYAIEGASERRDALRLGGAVALLFLAAVAANARLPRQRPSPDALRGASWNDAVVAAIRTDVAAQGFVGETDAFVTFAGTVNATALEWAARKAGLDASFRDAHRSGSLDELSAAARGAAYAVVADAERADAYPFLPSTRHQAALLEQLRADPDFRPLPCSVGTGPPRYHVFASRRVARELRPVFDDPRVVRVEGFLPDEGPYPQWNLRKVRWLSARAGRVCLKGDPRSSVVDVSATIRSLVQGALHVDLAGVRLATVPLGAVDWFQDLRFSVPVGAEGTCLELTVEGTIADPERLVLFRRFEVKDAAPAVGGVPRERDRSASPATAE